MTRNNPIAIAMDDTILSVLNDEKRTLAGFMEFAKFSVELERLQHSHLVNMLDDDMPGNQDPMPRKLYTAIAMAFWLGFETGKSYLINGHVDQMLKLEDEWNRTHGSEQAS